MMSHARQTGHSASREADAYRREVDREVVSLLRQLRKDNEEIISLLRKVADALARGASPTAASVADTGRWPALE
jgi:hypothetical protein